MRAGTGAARPAVCAGCGGHAPPGGVPRPPDRRRGRAGGLRGPPRRRCQLPPSDRGAVQRRRLQVAAAGRARRRPLSTPGCARRAASRRVCWRRRPGSRGRARRRVLRLRAARPRRAHPRRHRARVLRRRRVVHARGARHRAAAAGAVRRAVRHGGGHRGRAARARARPRGRRARALPLLRVIGAPPGRRRHAARSLGARRAARDRRDPATLAPRAAVRARSCRCGCTRASPRSARSSSKPCRAAATSVGRSSSTCEASHTKVVPARADAERGWDASVAGWHLTSSASTSAPRTPSSPTRQASGRLEDDAIRLFEIEQLVAPGEVASRGRSCPRCATNPRPGEVSDGDLALPWGASRRWGGGRQPGARARRAGARPAGRQREELAVARGRRSAGADPALGRPGRRGEGLAGEASASYLAHVRAAWDHRIRRPRWRSRRSC